MFGPLTIGPAYIVEFYVQNRQFGRSSQEQVELMRIYNKEGDCCDLGQRLILLTASKSRNTNWKFLFLTFFHQVLEKMEIIITLLFGRMESKQIGPISMKRMIMRLETFTYWYTSTYL